MNLWEQHKAERRRRILGAARKLITQGGVEALSMRQLAKESNLSVATLYNLYGSKADILYALLETAIDQMDTSLEAIPAEDPLVFADCVTELATGMFIREQAFYRPLMAAINNIHDKEHEPVIGRRAMIDIERCLAAGAEAGLFPNLAEANLISRQFYLTLMQAILAWSIGLYDDNELRRQSQYAILICMLGICAPDVRPAVLQRITELNAKLASAYPFAEDQLEEAAEAQ